MRAVVAAGDRLDGWIESAADCFERAAARADTSERQLRLAGASVRVRYAGTTLCERLSPALAHLAVTGVEPALTIDVWDGRADAPPLPLVEAGGPRGAVLYSADGVRRVAYRPGLGQLSGYDGETGRAWFWCESGAELPFWEPAAPFRQILHWWLADRGLLLLHGAAVGTAAGGVLLVGRGGSGKSTCALSALDSDLLFAGDDYVAVAPGPEPAVFSLYSSGKLQPGHARLLPHLPAPSFAGDGSPGEKAVFYVGDRFPERMCESFPLAAVVAPRVCGAEPRLSPLAPAQALAALAPSTLLQLVPGSTQTLARMATLLGRVPAYRLELGGPVDAIPPVIRRLLEELKR